MFRYLMLAGICVGILFATACRKQGSASPQAPGSTPEVSSQPAAPAAASSPTPPPAAPAPAPASGSALPQAQPGASENSKLNGPLTEAVSRFKDKHNRLPSSWQELIQTGFIKTLPTPPPGTRFAIDPISAMVVELPVK